jgi:hypothetical protein
MFGNVLAGRCLSVGKQLGITYSKLQPKQYYLEATSKTKGAKLKDIADFYYDYVSLFKTIALVRC